jgi:hypothetical protein
MDWMYVAQARGQWRVLVNTTINQSVEIFFSGCASDGFSRRTRLHGVSFKSEEFDI